MELSKYENEICLLTWGCIPVDIVFIRNSELFKEKMISETLKHPLRMDLSKINEWELSARFKSAFENELYEECADIKNEIEKRIQAGTLNKSLMDGFKYYNPETKTFEGKPNYNGLNGLYNNYK